MNVIRYRNEQQQMAICLLLTSGPKYHRVIPMDAAGIRLIRIPKQEERYFELINDYPIKKAISRFKKAGKKFGITKLARQELNSYRSEK